MMLTGATPAIRRCADRRRVRCRRHRYTRCAVLHPVALAVGDAGTRPRGLVERVEIAVALRQRGVVADRLLDARELAAAGEAWAHRRTERALRRSHCRDLLRRAAGQRLELSEALVIGLRDTGHGTAAGVTPPDPVALLVAQREALGLRQRIGQPVIAFGQLAVARRQPGIAADRALDRIGIGPAIEARCDGRHLLRRQRSVQPVEPAAGLRLAAELGAVPAARFAAEQERWRPRHPRAAAQSRTAGRTIRRNRPDAARGFTVAANSSTSSRTSRARSVIGLPSTAILRSSVRV